MTLHKFEVQRWTYFPSSSKTSGWR